MTEAQWHLHRWAQSVASGFVAGVLVAGVVVFGPEPFRRKAPAVEAPADPVEQLERDVRALQFTLEQRMRLSEAAAQVDALRERVRQIDSQHLARQ